MRCAKMGAVLKGTRGETLMEGVASILVFTILIAAVTLTIMVSLRMTGESNRAAADMQDSVKEVLEGEGDDSLEIIFSVNGETIEKIDVTVTEAGAFRAFAPSSP